MNRPRVYYIVRVALTTLLGVLLGGGILWASAYAVEAFDVLLIAMGMIGIISNLPTFALSLRAVIGKVRWEWINLSVSLLGMGLGLCFVLLQRGSAALPFLLVLYAVMLPLVRVLLVEKRGRQLLRELPKIFFGGFMLAVSLCEAESTMFVVLGFVFIGISALYLLFRLVTMQTYFEMYEERQRRLQEEESGE